VLLLKTLRIQLASVDEYSSLLNLISARQTTTIEDRKLFATKAFHVSSHDTAIFNYFNTDRYTKKVLPMVKYYVTENHIKKDFSLVILKLSLTKYTEKNYHITICLM
jgi:AICAR transformylase/IMP cyclohydrolase PurH